ncbi:MAG: hypothetical protein ACFN2Z_05305 [Oribacterium sp.]
MNSLHLSEEAQNDLMEIKAYIEEELLNPSVAKEPPPPSCKALASAMLFLKFRMASLSSPCCPLFAFRGEKPRCMLIRGRVIRNPLPFVQARGGEGSFDTGILYLTSFVGAAMIKKSL